MTVIIESILLIHLNNSIEDFDDILGKEMINGELFYRFQYTVYPKIRLVSE